MDPLSIRDLKVEADELVAIFASARKTAKDSQEESANPQISKSANGNYLQIPARPGRLHHLRRSRPRHVTRSRSWRPLTPAPTSSNSAFPSAIRSPMARSSSAPANGRCATAPPGWRAEARAPNPAQQSNAGLIIFSYLNPILQLRPGAASAPPRRRRGRRRAGHRSSGRGSADYLRAMKAHELAPVFLAAPTSTDQRLQSIAEHLARFRVCHLAHRRYRHAPGTGQRRAPLVERLRRYTKLPIAVGFGVSTAGTVREVGSSPTPPWSAAPSCSGWKKSAAGKRPQAVAELVQHSQLSALSDQPIRWSQPFLRRLHGSVTSSEAMDPRVFWLQLRANG